MSRKDELLKMASLLRLQADALSSRDGKQAFQKMANYYQHEAELLQKRNAAEITEQSTRAQSRMKPRREVSLRAI